MPKLKVGDKMPEFTFATEKAASKKMSELLGGKRTVIWVLRYIGCTTCRYDVDQLARRYKEFEAKGVQAAVLMQSEPEIVLHDLKGQVLPFEIICDTKQEIYKALDIKPAETEEGLLHRTEENMKKFQKKIRLVKEAGFEHGKYEGNELQLPALFIVEADGTVSYAHYANDILDMPDVDGILALL